MRLFSRFRSGSRSGKVAIPKPSREIIRRAARMEGLEDRRLFAANLVLSNAGLPSPNVNAGANITYTVTVRNIGSDFATGVHLTDVIPTNTTFVSVNQISGPTFTRTNPTVLNGQTLSEDLGVLDPSTSAVFRIIVKVGAATASGTVITDTASVSTTSTPEDTSDNSQDVSTLVNTLADVLVTKTKVTPGATVVAGTDVTYSIHVANNGPSNADNVSFSDIVPALTTFVSVSQTGGPAFTVNSTPPVGQAGTIQETIPVLGTGLFADFTVVLHISSGALDTDTVFNTARVTTTTFDPSQANNFSTVGNDVEIQTDIQIFSDSDKVSPLIEGNYFPYTVTIFNAGPSDAQAVTFNWNTPNFPGNYPPDFRVYYRTGGGGSPVQLISGPAFAISLPADPPEPRGVITGSLATLPSGVATTYQFFVGTAENQDLVQTSSAGTSSPDTNPANNTHTDNVHIYDAPLVVQSVPNVQGIASQPVFVNVMDYTDTNAWPGNSVTPRYTVPTGRYHELGDFTATVDWGDGSVPTTGVISVDSQGTYKVNASHVYAVRGTYAVHTVVTSDGESLAIGDAIAIIGTPSRGGAGVINLKFTENVSETKKVAVFFPGTAASGTTYTGTISWGDGKPNSAATLTLNSGGGYDIAGTHLYDDQGTYTATVTVVGSDAVTNVITPIQIVVDDRAVLATGVDVTAQTGITASNVTVATFTDPGGSDPVGTYTATIDWGDGSAVDVGTITFAAGTFTVKGSHAWAAAGTYNMSIKISHGTAPDAIVTPNANVSAGPVNPAVTATAVNFTANTNVAANNVTVATFTDPSGPDVVGNYTAVIDWGDGSPTNTGVITLAGTTFSVKGTHTFAVAGSYNMTVTINHGNSPDAIVNPVATVIDGSAITNVTPVPVVGVEGQTLSSRIVGRFQTSNLAALTSDFSVTILWGDGTAQTAGSVVKTAAGQFNVVGTHLYKDDGTFAVTVKVTPNNNPQVTINSSALISEATLRGISRLFTATKNVTFTNGIVGSFADNNSFAITPSAYTVSILWGDGTAATVGSVAYNAALKQFDVRGTHKYLKVSPVGGFKLTITVVEGSTQVKITSTATVK